MKICVLTALYKSTARGGAEIVAESVIQELSKVHNLFVVTLSLPQGFRSLRSRGEMEDGIRIYRFAPLNLFSFISIGSQPFWLRIPWHFIDFFQIHSFFVVWRIIAREQPAVVLSHNIKGLGYLLPLLIRILRIRHIHTLHDVQLLTPSGLVRTDVPDGVLKKATDWMYQFICRMLFGSPSVVLFPSRFLLKVYGERGFFPHSNYLYFPNPTQQLVQSDGPRVPTPLSFVFFGQLEPHKGILFLLDAWRAWAHSSATLTIAGSGSCEGVVRAAAGGTDSRIRYIGALKHAEVGSLLKSAYCVIVPTLCAENAPLVVCESLSMSVPVIVAASGGAAEYISDGKNGYIVNPGDRDELIAALERMSTLSLRKYQDFSTAAQAAVENLPDTQLYGAALEKLL